MTLLCKFPCWGEWSGQIKKSQDPPHLRYPTTFWSPVESCTEILPHLRVWGPKIWISSHPSQNKLGPQQCISLRCHETYTSIKSCQNKSWANKTKSFFKIACYVNGKDSTPNQCFSMHPVQRIGKKFRPIFRRATFNNIMAFWRLHRNALYRAWQINRINKINSINRINNRLMNPCKLGLGLIPINNRLIPINDGLIPINDRLIRINKD